METRYTSKFDALDIIICIAGFICIIVPIYYWIGESHFTVSSILIIVAGMLLVAFAYWRSNKAILDISALEKRICRELNEQGYEYTKHDGILYVKKNDNTFHIHLWDTINKRVKRLYIIYDFEDERYNNITKEGWAIGTNRINTDNPHATFITFADSFQCRYETAISNAKDFLPEFETAYQIIADVVDEYRRMIPYIERDYPNKNTENKTNIGFVNNN